jgi:hypothetical protein
VPASPFDSLEQFEEMFFTYESSYPVFKYSEAATDLRASLYRLDKHWLYVKGLPPLTPTIPKAPRGEACPPHCGYETS